MHIFNISQRSSSVEMGRETQPKTGVEDPKSRTQVHKCTYKNCRKKYKTISALNNHKRIRHSNVRWKCPFCEEEQVSKDKHDLHIQRKHRTKWKSSLNLDRHQICKNRKTPKAKDAIIKTQQETIDEQLEKLLKYKTCLIEVKKELRETKKKLSAANRKLKDLGCIISGDEKSDSEIEDGIGDRSGHLDDDERESDEGDRSPRSDRTSGNES